MGFVVCLRFKFEWIILFVKRKVGDVDFIRILEFGGWGLKYSFVVIYYGVNGYKIGCVIICIVIDKILCV